MIFGWAVTRELIPPEKYVAMKAMKLLKAYPTHARELEKVKHVPDSVIEQTLPHLPKFVRHEVAFSVSREYVPVSFAHCDRRMLTVLR